MPWFYSFRINEEREGIVELLHDRPRHIVLRLPSIIERDDRALRRNGFLAAPPGHEILHRNYRDVLVFQLLHLSLERGRRDLGIGPAHVVDETVITENHDLRVLIDRRFANRRRGRRGRGGSRRGASRPRTWGRRRRLFGIILRNARELLTARQEQREKQRKNGKSFKHKCGKAL